MWALDTTCWPKKLSSLVTCYLILSSALSFQAVRASSAAPYYLDDFLTPDGKRFQDGATTANNPAAIALQQARLLHPQLPVDCLVSLGCGSEPAAERSKGLSSVGCSLTTAHLTVDQHKHLAGAYPAAVSLSSACCKGMHMCMC